MLAADHRARGVMTVERWDDLLGALRAALPHCDGLMATTRPLVELKDELGPTQTAWLSLNRTGLAGTPFELDDRLVASCARAAGVAIGRAVSQHPDPPGMAEAIAAVVHG